MSKMFTMVLSDIDPAHPVNLLDWELDSDCFDIPGMPKWSVKRKKLSGGKQEGVDIITVDNGRMSFTVVPVRGMNVYEACCDGVRLGWQNPVGQIVHPWWVDRQARGGTGWLDGFNELMCRCGLESTGRPCTDVFVDKQGNRNELALTLHSNLSNTPAIRVWFYCELEPPYRLGVGGEVLDARMFGPSYLLRTEISTRPGSAEFEVGDEVLNAGDVSVEMELLYHCNFGLPVIGEGARVFAPVRKLSAINAHSLSGVKEWDRIGPPQAGSKEQCYPMKLYGDKEGRSIAALVNRERDLGSWVGFSLESLPAFTLWKNNASEKDGYVVGLEPGTDYPNSRPFERRQGRVVTLEPGTPYKTAVTIGLARGDKEVEALCGRIEEMSAGAPQVCDEVDGELAGEGE